MDSDFVLSLRDAASDLRRRLSAEVSEEQILAYLERELSGEEQERVEEAIALDPRAAQIARRLIAVPAPPAPGEPGHLSDRELEEDWERLRSRVAPHTAEPLRPAPSRLVALAASVLVVAVLAWGVQERSRRVVAERELARASDLLLNIDVHTLSQNTLLGSEAEELPERLSGSGELLLLQLEILDLPRPFDDYRLEIQAIAPPGQAPLVKRVGLRLNANYTFTVALRRSSLPPGRYEIRVVGLRGGDEELLFADRVEMPPQ